MFWVPVGRVCMPLQRSGPCAKGTFENGSTSTCSPTKECTTCWNYGLDRDGGMIVISRRSSFCPFNTMNSLIKIRQLLSFSPAEYIWFLELWTSWLQPRTRIPRPRVLPSISLSWSRPLTLLSYGRSSTRTILPEQHGMEAVLSCVRCRQKVQRFSTSSWTSMTLVRANGSFW